MLKVSLFGLKFCFVLFLIESVMVRFFVVLLKVLFGRLNVRVVGVVGLILCMMKVLVFVLLLVLKKCSW